MHMIRRRRPARGIDFSFDSFLDVVANVVGIILRLILVAWVGAKSYKAFQPPPVPPPPELEEVIALPDPDDPLAAELDRQRRELAAVQEQFLEQLRRGDEVRAGKSTAETETADLAARRRELEQQLAGLEKAARDSGAGGKATSLSLQEIQERSKHLVAEIDALRKAPPAKQTLRYRAPVSRELQSEELFLECRKGRVTVIDLGGLYEQVRKVLRDQGEKLRTRREVSDVTPAVGVFQMRYVVERERETHEEVVPGLAPDGRANFRFGVASWELQPIADDRGESTDQALAAGSEFRRVIDALDPHQTAVTLWVYPDSFPLYRKLRDYLHDRNVVVAGRPLPEGAPISGSRHGTVSRGQ
jgi:hypothetical protein